MSSPDLRSAPPTRRQWLRQTSQAAGLAGIAAALAGCGFQLRRSSPLAVQRIALAGFSSGSPMDIALRRALDGQAEIVSTAAAAQAVLVALSETREKSVLASTPGALVREIQLRLKFRFRVDAAGGRPGLPAIEIGTSRDMSFNETLALAKSHEETQIYREMEADVARQVLQRIALLRP